MSLTIFKPTLLVLKDKMSSFDLMADSMKFVKPNQLSMTDDLAYCL